MEQVRFFRHVDILISGHGAQLTGVPFMMQRLKSDPSSFSSCKLVLELYPKLYGVPYYFGSLVVQSGIRHSYLYYDDGIDDDDETSKEIDDSALQHLEPKTILPWERTSASTYKKRWWARTTKF